MPPGFPQAQVVIWSLAFLASPGLILPVWYARANLERGSDPQAMLRGMHTFRLFFITLTMTAIGMVALVIWDGMFPDRRDARILTGLPLPGRLLIGARLLALSALCGIFVVGVNIVPTIFYAPTIAVFGGAANLPLGILGFVVANGLAGAFVFSALVALQGLVLNLGGRRAADQLSLALQVSFVMVLLQMVLFMPRVAAMLTADLTSGWVLALPSVWFLGLYDVIGGRPVVGSPALAGMALLATAAAVGAAILLFVATHDRLTRRALESREISGGRNGLTTESLAQVLCQRPAARAVFGFTVKTLTRSRSHRLLMAIYVGGALALVASGIVPVALTDGLAGFTTPGVVLLSAPLVIGFFALVGMRVALAIPVEPKANWIFRQSEPGDRAAAIDGVRAAMLVVGVLPTSLLAIVTAGALWGAWSAVAHAAICTVMGWLLVEILLMGVVKIPFTCSYFPGRSRVGTLWSLYLTGFATYSFTTAAWEVEFLARPRAVAIFIAVIASAITVLTIRRHRHLASLHGLRFHEEDPGAIFAGFHLSEGLAARAAAAASTNTER
jgi:hypothetical protein